MSLISVVSQTSKKQEDMYGPAQQMPPSPLMVMVLYGRCM